MKCETERFNECHPCEDNSMSQCESNHNYHHLQHSLLFALLALAPLANAQAHKTLLLVQRMRAELESESNALAIGRNAYDAGINGSQQMDLRQYPNTATCLIVYDDGKYFFEKREERTIGKPKAKSAGGVLAADDLQRLKAILGDEELKQIATPKALALPPDAQLLTEAERLDVQIDRAGTPQQFSFTRERVKTGATITGASSGGLSGMETTLDNGTPYKKTVAPLLKFSDDVGKKNKLKDSKPQYCQAMSGS
jgi:hypothetical protein